MLHASGLQWKAGNVDFTGAQMVLTLKLIAAAVSFQDGLKGQEASGSLLPPPCLLSMAAGILL